MSAPGAERSCAEVERIASLHRDEVRAKIADLQALDGVLSDMVEECQGGTLPTCPLVEALSGDRA